jgi:hypothetical protein
MPRSGSTLLTTALMQHPDVLMLGELFHEVPSERRGSHAFDWRGARTNYEPGEDALAFLERTVWSEQGKRAAGFKLFAEYVRGRGTERLFPRLRGQIPGLRVVHIVRDRLLDSWASREAAKRTGEWQSHKRSGRNDVRLRADPAAVERFFETYASANRWMAKLFAGGDYHRVSYDDLSGRFDDTMAGVFDFLDVPRTRIAPMIAKQRSATAAEQIENFADLRAHFRGTRFAKQFR